MNYVQKITCFIFLHLIFLSGCTSTSAQKLQEPNGFDSKNNIYTYYQKDIVDYYDRPRVGSVELLLSYSPSNDFVIATLISSKIKDWTNFIIKSSDLKWREGDKRQVSLADNCERTENSLICKLKKSDFLELNFNKHVGVSFLVLTANGITIPTKVIIENEDIKYCNKVESARLRQDVLETTSYDNCMINAKYKAVQKMTSGTGFVNSLSPSTKGHTTFFQFIDNISK